MSDLLGYAAELGLDVRTFREDLRRRVHAGRVERDIASADTSGVFGTPTFFFNGQRHHGAHNLGALTQALEAAREAAEHARSGLVPREQLCVLRVAARRHRTRVPRELTGRAARVAAPLPVRVPDRRPSISGRSRARRAGPTRRCRSASRTGGHLPPEWTPGGQLRWLMTFHERSLRPGRRRAAWAQRRPRPQPKSNL
jgi:hypothetical protein